MQILPIVIGIALLVDSLHIFITKEVSTNVAVAIALIGLYFLGTNLTKK